MFSITRFLNIDYDRLGYIIFIMILSHLCIPSLQSMLQLSINGIEATTFFHRNTHEKEEKITRFCTK